MSPLKNLMALSADAYARYDRRFIYLALIGIFTFCIHIWAPTAFAGWDDLYYFKAAQRWISEGVHIPSDHWAARLPHVLLLALTMRVTQNEYLMLLPNVGLFAVTLLCGWRIAGAAMGAQAAVATTVMLAFTPLLFRQAGSFYPEGLEIACCASSVLLAFSATQKETPLVSRSTALLICAGVMSGLAVFVRQTALLVPAALALFFLVKHRAEPVRAVRYVATFAFGYMLVAVSELMFYAIMTGDPLYRLIIDRRNLTIPSVYLTGGVFLEESILFNWKLAALWIVPESFNIHWTINPVMNILFSQQVLLAPWLALGGLAVARSTPGPYRELCALAALILALQYFCFTYVFVLPPNISYYGASVFMLCVIGGMFIASRPKNVQATLIACVVACGIFIASLQRSYPYFTAAVRSFALQSGVLHTSNVAADRLYWALQSDQDVAKHLRVGHGPKGALAVFAYEDASLLDQRCTSGEPRWRIVKTHVRPTIYWRVGEWVGVGRRLPPRVAALLRRDPEMAVFALRQC